MHLKRTPNRDAQWRLVRAGLGTVRAWPRLAYEPSPRDAAFIMGAVAGPGTFRGCSFQAAYSVVLALDLLEGGGEALVLEGDADIVDAAVERAIGRPSRHVQAKTKVEPYVWTPQEISAVVTEWLAGDPPTTRPRRRGAQAIASTI